MLVAWRADVHSGPADVHSDPYDDNRLAELNVLRVLEQVGAASR
jgi:hypothetical protein